MFAELCAAQKCAHGNQRLLTASSLSESGAARNTGAGWRHTARFSRIAQSRGRVYLAGRGRQRPPDARREWQPTVAAPAAPNVRRVSSHIYPLSCC
jgi:hypothetical protein